MTIPYRVLRRRIGDPADSIDRLPEVEGKRSRKPRADRAREVERETVPVKAEHDPGAYN